MLAGYSLGGLCTALYAQRHPEKVKAPALIGTVVSGALSIAGHVQHAAWKKWGRTGWRKELRSIPSAPHTFRDRAQLNALKTILTIALDS